MTFLQEIAWSHPGKVDEDAGIIYNVKILGKHSKNGRVYTDKAMDDAARVYEGLAVNIDHPDGPNAGKERKFHEGIGELRNVRRIGEENRGDLYYAKSHPYAPLLVERAQRFPNNFGLSHNVEGETSRRRDGMLQVESVTKGHSVDVVSRPATNKGLFESEGETMQLSEWIAANTDQDASVLEKFDGTLQIPESCETVKAVLGEVLKKGIEDSNISEITQLIEGADMIAENDNGAVILTEDEIQQFADRLEPEAAEFLDTLDLTHEDVATLSAMDDEELGDTLADLWNQSAGGGGDDGQGVDEEAEEEFAAAASQAESVLQDFENRLSILEAYVTATNLLESRGLKNCAETRNHLLQAEDGDHMRDLLEGIPVNEYRVTTKPAPFSVTVQESMELPESGEGIGKLWNGKRRRN